MRQIESVVFIDDDKLTLEFNRELMEKSKMCKSILCFSDAEEALEALTSIPESLIHTYPSLIFVDIEMPNMNGHDFLKLLQDSNGYDEKKVQVVFLSSHNTLGNLVQALDRNIEFFIKKPLTPSKIEDIVYACADKWDVKLV